MDGNLDYINKNYQNIKNTNEKHYLINITISLFVSGILIGKVFRSILLKPCNIKNSIK